MIKVYIFLIDQYISRKYSFFSLNSAESREFKKMLTTKNEANNVNKGKKHYIAIFALDIYGVLYSLIWQVDYQKDIVEKNMKMKVCCRAKDNQLFPQVLEYLQIMKLLIHTHTHTHTHTQSLRYHYWHSLALFLATSWENFL